MAVLLSGCASSPLARPAADSATDAGLSEPVAAGATLPTVWWNFSVELSTLTSAQVNGFAVHPTQVFSNCIEMSVEDRAILGGTFSASWTDPGSLVLYTWQRDQLDPNQTARASADGPSVLTLDAPPTEELPRDLVFAGVGVPPGGASAGTNVKVRLDVSLLLQAVRPPGDDAVTPHGCSFDQAR